MFGIAVSVIWYKNSVSNINSKKVENIPHDMSDFATF